MTSRTSMRPDDPALTVSLPRSAWVALISSLGQRPYAEVAELIEEIIRQAGAQLEPRESATDTTMSARTN